MPKLEWYDNPRTVSQSILNAEFQYSVMYPSVQLNLVDPKLSFHDKDGYMALALKKTPEGMLIQYVIGHGYRRDSDAQEACQADYDQWGDKIPPDKMPPPPPSLERRM